MDKKNKPKKKVNSQRMLKRLPLFGLVCALLLCLLMLLLYIGKIDKTIAAAGVFEAYLQIEVQNAVKDTVVDDILVEIGERVEKGGVLIRLQDREGLFERISQLEKSLKLAEIDFERLKQLSAKGHVCLRGKEGAELVVKLLTAEISAFQRRIESLTIVAPSAGTVVLILVEIGEAVYMGQELVLLAPSEESALRMWINEEDISKAMIGQDVRIRSRVFCHRQYGVASGNIVEIKPHHELRDGGTYVEVVTRITESPFPVRIGSRANAEIIIKRVSILESLVGME